jgi:hypothetical protein
MKLKFFITLFIFSFTFSAKSQELENAIYVCIQDEYAKYNIKFKPICDSTLKFIGGDSISKNKIFASYFKFDSLDISARFKYSQILKIQSDSLFYPILTHCFNYFSHRDGHEKSIKNEIGEFLNLFSKKANREDYFDFFKSLPEENFLQPCYITMFRLLFL